MLNSYFRFPITTFPWCIGIWLSDSQNTIHFMVNGLKNAYFMHFSPLSLWAFTSYLHFSFLTRPFCHSSTKEKNHGKTYFWGQNLFHVIFNHNSRSNGRWPLKKITKGWLLRRGVNQRCIFLQKSIFIHEPQKWPCTRIQGHLVPG